MSMRIRWPITQQGGSRYLRLAKRGEMKVFRTRFFLSRLLSSERNKNSVLKDARRSLVSVSDELRMNEIVSTTSRLHIRSVSL